MAQTHVQALDLSFQHNQGFFAQAAFLGLQDFTFVEAVVDGLGEGVLLRIRHMTTVEAYPLLERSITLVNLLLVCENLVVFCLDLLEQMSYFSWSVCHWKLGQHHKIAQDSPKEGDLPSCMNCSSTDAASSGIWRLMAMAAGSGSCEWRKLLDCPRDYDAVTTTDHKSQEFEAEIAQRLDGSDGVDLK